MTTRLESFSSLLITADVETNPCDSRKILAQIRVRPWQFMTQHIWSWPQGTTSRAPPRT